MFKRRVVLGLILSAALLFLMFPSNCFAGCTIKPVISGVVTDCSDNSSISGVKVTYYDNETYTTDNGSYETTSAEEGWYFITYEKPSYIKKYLFGIWKCEQTYTRDICLYADSDGDGITDTDDNCVNIPNGPDNGTCTAGNSDKMGIICDNNTQCGDGGFCSMDQEDSDNDGIPFWWEDKYGFNPLKWDNHSIDYDKDGLTDLQEYYMTKNLSDPFAKDIFLEIDYMHDYKPSNESVEMLCNAFAAHNITIHVFIDDEIPMKEWKNIIIEDIKNIREYIAKIKEKLGKALEKEGVD